MRELVANFGSRVLFHNSAGADYGCAIKDVVQHPLPAVMSVVDANLGFLYPRHLELTGKQRWDHYPLLPRSCPVAPIDVSLASWLALLPAFGPNLQV